MADAGQEEVSTPGVIEDGDVTDVLFCGLVREGKEKSVSRRRSRPSKIQ